MTVQVTYPGRNFLHDAHVFDAVGRPDYAWFQEGGTRVLEYRCLPHDDAASIVTAAMKLSHIIPDLKVTTHG